jgi:predicted Zn-dependent protease
MAIDQVGAARAIAREAVGRALDAGADAAEAHVVLGHDALTRFAAGEIHQNVAETAVTVRLRSLVAGRTGVAVGDRTDATGLAALAGSTISIARLSPEPERAPVLAAATTLTLVPGAWSEATAATGPEDRAEAVRAIVAAADAVGVGAYGSFRTEEHAVAVVSSAGTDAGERRTLAQTTIVTMGPGGGTGYAARAAVDRRDLDAAALGREASAGAVASRDAQRLEPATMPVVLSPYAVADILEMLAYVGFSGLAAEEGRSFSTPGRVVGSPLVSIVDDAADPAGVPVSFDDEGVAKQRVVLIDRGVCGDVVHDAATAHRAGVRSTGHALPAPNPWGPFPTNMAMAAGDATTDELVAGVADGLYVTRFHYTNPVHQKLAIITGMTRDGLFRIRDGRIGGPVRDLRFTFGYLDALAAVEAVGRDRLLIPGGFGPVLVPALRIGRWAFTGATGDAS